MAHSTRPTLPPLHTLDLPRGDIPLPRIHDVDHISRRTAKLRVPCMLPHCHQERQLPVPASSSSRPPSPPGPCLRPCTNTPATISTSNTPFPNHKIRLEPTSFEDADAVVLVAPPSASDTTPPQALLLVGSALQRLRQRQRQLAKDIRLHPYRIVRRPRPPTEPLASQTKA